ncbi:MAG: single-stranded DNA-binding protein [Anaerolineales bacterium]|uniref:Single-stranded DNA-binding protein n=1 Tax=Candidatus Desulfolinea nitratireducens TaxID=2841698 RepID=A0A8J6THJ4_9CHLR|nr:single-stranded DNA-binding protein [Candidatus Desulfolinea nitratireducens]MBL6961861.1 single-stranded DNA-binding protein [Anaerolineales bacterium]
MYQKLVLVGNLGNDPEMRYTPNGQAVTNLSIATNRQYTANSGEKVKETTWFRVSVWGKQAEACNTYLKKGSKVLVEGRMTADSATGGPRIWTANDGSPRASFEVTAQTVRFLSSRSDDQGGGDGGGGDYGQGQDNMMPPSDDDIPF